MNYQEFMLSDLFYKPNLKCLKKDFVKSKDLSKIRNSEFNLPLVNAKHGNNGIMYYGREQDWEYETMCIDVVNDGAIATGDVYPQPQKTGVLYNAYLIKPYYEDITENILLYLSISIEKAIKHKYGYDNKAGWEKVKNEVVILPTTDGKTPDYKYMNDYIEKIQNEIVENYNDFLKENDLIEIEINEKEKEIFQKNKKYKKIKLEEIFESQNGDTDIKQSDLNDEGIMVVSSGEQNYGIIGKTDLSAKIIPGNTITVDMFGNVYYREQDYKMVTHARVFSLESKERIDKEVNLYFVALLKYLKELYSYQNMCSWNKIKNDYIEVPIDDDGCIDYEYMGKYISYIEKRIMKNN